MKICEFLLVIFDMALIAHHCNFCFHLQLINNFCKFEFVLVSFGSFEIDLKIFETQENELYDHNYELWIEKKLWKSDWPS